MFFKYKSTKRPDGSFVKTPSIPIIFSGPKESIPIISLLDSGADFSVIPKDIAELLGIDLSEKPHQSFGIGGAVESINSSVNITIERGHEKHSFRIPILVILDEYSFPPLLGREGFFEHFKVLFEQKHLKVSLKKENESLY
jgi:predicted aspartyl protease